MKMSESVFESFEAYLKGADYPKGKKKIMQAAVDLISTKSYNGTSTLQIAKHAGLSQATLFKYFKTKEDAFAWLEEKCGESIKSAEDVKALDERWQSKSEDAYWSQRKYKITN